MGVVSREVLMNSYLSRVLQQAARGRSGQVIPERSQVVEQSFGFP